MASLDNLEKWADRIYSETDLSRGIATSASGIIGLCVYLAKRDVAIALFSLVIAFPLIRALLAPLFERLKSASERKKQQKLADTRYNSLSADEKAVIDGFIRAGGSVMTWGCFNRTALSTAAIETLIQRRLLSTSVTADGMTETFVRHRCFRFGPATGERGRP
jgi:hypothetical protein